MVLSEEDFSLATLPTVNPSLKDFNASGTIGWLKEVVDGAEFKISITAPIEFAVRCFMNTAMRMTKGTDVGDWVQKLVKADMTRLQEGISVLLSKELKQASSQLTSLLNLVPTILEIEDEEERKIELNIFQQQALLTRDHAQGAYVTVKTVEEKILAVQIVVSTLIATHATGRNAKALGRDLSTEIEKLLQLPRVLSDARHQLHPDPSESALDFKRAREERIKAVVMVVLHAESFAATNNLNPILPKQKTRGSYLNLNLSKRKSLGAQSYPVKALLLSGIFEDKTTVEEFKNLLNPFSDKELCVVAGFLEESVDGVAFIEEGGKKEAAERKAKEEADRAAEERRKKEEAMVREANAKQKKKEERQEAKEKTEREEKAKADERKGWQRRRKRSSTTRLC